MYDQSLGSSRYEVPEGVETVKSESILREKIDQRLKDLAGQGENQEKRGQLIEAKSAQMVLDDLMQAADFAYAVASRAAVCGVVEPTIEDVLAINQLYQAYIGPAYQTLLVRGEIPPPPSSTMPSSVTSKADLAS